MDTPGLADNPLKDAEYIKDMINLIKKEVKFVNVFAFVTDDGRWNSTTTNLIKIFEDNFGTGFWHHFAIVYTRWGFDSASEKRRKKAKIS